MYFQFYLVDARPPDRRADIDRNAKRCYTAAAEGITMNPRVLDRSLFAPTDAIMR